MICEGKSIKNTYCSLSVMYYLHNIKEENTDSYQKVRRCCKKVSVDVMGGAIKVQNWEMNKRNTEVKGRV